MKQYLLFYADSYYPGGGWRDFVDSFDTHAEAEAAIKTVDCSYQGEAMIVNTASDDLAGISFTKEHDAVSLYDVQVAPMGAEEKLIVKPSTA